MRWSILATIVLALASGCTSRPPPREQPVAAAATTDAGSVAGATTDLPPALGDSLIGCWRLAGSEERWRFERAADGHLQVVRSVDAADPAASGAYGERARLPATVHYDSTAGTIAFTAAGHIHGLMFVMRKDGAKLEVDSYASRVPGESYRSTGNHFSVERCPTP